MVFCVRKFPAGSDDLNKRLAQAEHLCALLPNEATGLVAAARLCAFINDKDKARGYLKLAAEQSLFQSRNERWADLMRKQYLDSGRTAEQARIRLQLETSCPETGALLQLGKQLGMREWNFHQPEMVETQIQFLAVIQKLDENPLFDAPSKSYAARAELAALVSLQQATNVDSSKYLTVPIEEALGEAERHQVTMRYFNRAVSRVDQVFENLAPEARENFLNISSTDGQIGALMWVRQNHPDALILR